ncbi:prenyltransferase/squalene oxidase repeat-containing protein [Amycolatopsis sp. NPDC058340]|uniref:prenyltransferase/squalene oxidase repeat-containing protein n=1 Tax=Amycolatopsis sp. NPDC058340 TaxID=3346453 RepID=UPI00366566F0
MRRGYLAATAFAVCVAVIAAPLAGTATAANDPGAAKAGSRWLAAKLKPDGTLDNPNGGSLPDHGLMLDVLFAMYAAGEGSRAEPIVKFLDDQGHATDYFTWDGLAPGAGYDKIVVGGAVAKTLVAAQVSGRDPRRFDGHDLVAETQGAIMRKGPDTGRISDYAKDPALADAVSNNANMFGQALGVIGLAAAGVNDRLAIDKLLTQQCSEGYFRVLFAYIPTKETGDHVTPDGRKVSTCDEGKPLGLSPTDGDATGLALSAMLAAKKAGAAGLDAPIAKAVSWLKANQTPGGGWGGGVGTEAPNTNSTGLIVQALADAGGADAAVDKGVRYLESAQANAAADSGNKLAGELGAIAYDPASYEAARSSGISGVDTWIRASAQASLGLSQVGFYALAKGVPESPAPTARPHRPTPNPTTPKPKKVVTPKASTGARVSTATAITTPADTTPAARLGAYLANRLVGGDHVEVTEDGKTYVDYDATADVVLALRALDQQPDAVARASRFLLKPEAVRAYAHGAPYEQGEASYAEPLAKLVLVAEFAKSDATGPLRADLVKLRGADGEFTDTGSFADADRTVERHAWAVLATAADPGPAVELLLSRQCADGTFPKHLDTAECGSGDLAATAAAVTALVARPHTDAAPPARRPDGWTERRVSAVVSAVGALGVRPTGEGLVTGEGGETDVALSAAVAAARQTAGLDASGTARSLGKLVQADGGFAKGAGGESDFPTSSAAAQGIAGRSWLTAADSPLSPAIRLPLSDTAAPGPQVLAAAQSGARPDWLVWGLAGLAVLFLAAAITLVFVLRRITKKKGVTP